MNVISDHISSKLPNLLDLLLEHVAVFTECEEFDALVLSKDDVKAEPQLFNPDSFPVAEGGKH